MKQAAEPAGREDDMTIRERVSIKPGGLIEIRRPDLPVGAEAEVIVILESQSEEQDFQDLEYDPTVPPIWETVVAIGASIPEEEWDKVPRDLSKNLDHYLYGAPKEEEE
jgi:hypothetical protein